MAGRGLYLAGVAPLQQATWLTQILSPDSDEMPLAPAAVGQNKTHTKDQLSVCDSEFRKEASRPRSAPDRPKSWPRKRPGMDPHIPPRAPDAVRGRAEEQPPMGKNVRSWRGGAAGRSPSGKLDHETTNAGPHAEPLLRPDYRRFEPSTHNDDHRLPSHSRRIPSPGAQPR